MPHRRGCAERPQLRIEVTLGLAVLLPILLEVEHPLNAVAIPRPRLWLRWAGLARLGALRSGLRGLGPVEGGRRPWRQRPHRQECGGSLGLAILDPILVEVMLPLKAVAITCPKLVRSALLVDLRRLRLPKIELGWQRRLFQPSARHRI